MSSRDAQLADEIRAIHMAGGTVRDRRQAKVAAWAKAAFGEDQATNREQRGLRLLEEAIELAQAAGVDKVMAHLLIDFIYERPKGEIAQELGGVGLTLLAMAAAERVSADGCEANELQRVLSKGLEHFAARNQQKNDAGFQAIERAR